MNDSQPEAEQQRTYSHDHYADIQLVSGERLLLLGTEIRNEILKAFDPLTLQALDRTLIKASVVYYEEVINYNKSNELHSFRFVDPTALNQADIRLDQIAIIYEDRRPVTVRKESE